MKAGMRTPPLAFMRASKPEVYGLFFGGGMTVAVCL